MQLKNNLEDLIRKGFFSQYKKFAKEQEDRDQAQTEDILEPSKRYQSKRPINEISVIFGPPVSRNHLKNEVRGVSFSSTYETEFPEISFGPQDCRGLVHPHNDPLVCSI